jgi:hypothetical protein
MTLTYTSSSRHPRFVVLHYSRVLCLTGECQVLSAAASQASKVCTLACTIVLDYFDHTSIKIVASAKAEASKVAAASKSAASQASSPYLVSHSRLTMCSKRPPQLRKRLQRKCDSSQPHITQT